jgi:hypothetical protein
MCNLVNFFSQPKVKWRFKKPGESEAAFFCYFGKMILLVAVIIFFKWNKQIIIDLPVITEIFVRIKRDKSFP